MEITDPQQGRQAKQIGNYLIGKYIETQNGHWAKVHLVK